MTPSGQDDDENEQEAPDYYSSSNNQSRTNVRHDDENNDAPTWFLTTTLFASLWELLELLGYVHDASVSSLDESDDDDANDRQEETPRTVTAEERQTTIRHNQGSTSISSLGNSTDPPAVEHDDGENDDDSSPTTTTTTIVVDPCPPKAPWRRAILTCLCTAPQKSSRHLTIVPALSGLVLIVLPFAWTDHTSSSSSSSHWAKVVGGLQIALGVWSIGPTSLLLWWVPLTRPHEQRRHGVAPRDHVADALVYMHIGMPVFVLVMVIDVVLFALVLVSHALFLAHYESNTMNDDNEDDNTIHISVVAIPLLILRSVFLVACTVEPVIQTYHHFSTIPFYPFCLCYCCCPRWFRCCHRWWTRRGGNFCCCFGCCCGCRRKRRS